MTETPAGALAVELRGITKRFPGVIANHDIDITVRKGTVHAIVGENGAGKSTLMKILYGMQRPDEGTISIDGEQVVLHSPSAAIERGVGMVHQHFQLADNLTVLENIVLGNEPTSGLRLDSRTARASIRELGQRYGLEVDPDDLVEDLGVGDRQRVEILKVLYRGAQILILDEPTAVLVPQEVDELFGALRRAEGAGPDGHLHLAQARRGAVRLPTTSRSSARGTTVATVAPGDVTARQLAELMVGSELPLPETGESTVTDHVVLAVSRPHRWTTPTVGRCSRTCSLTIHSGEVLGIAGVEGNGQAELVECIMGMRTPTAGQVRLERRRHHPLDDAPAPRGRHRLHPGGPAPARAAARGAAVGEPHARAPDRSRPTSRGRCIDRRGARADTERIVARVRRPHAEHRRHRVGAVRRQPAEAHRRPRDERRARGCSSPPTRPGVSTSAPRPRSGTCCARRAGDGLAVLLISADLDELIGLSDTPAGDAARPPRRRAPTRRP